MTVDRIDLTDLEVLLEQERAFLIAGDFEGLASLFVTSREVVRVFLKQLWFQFVPVFHGLQGRSTMKN